MNKLKIANNLGNSRRKNLKNFEHFWTIVAEFKKGCIVLRQKFS